MANISGVTVRPVSVPKQVTTKTPVKKPTTTVKSTTVKGRMAPINKGYICGHSIVTNVKKPTTTVKSTTVKGKMAPKLVKPKRVFSDVYLRQPQGAKSITNKPIHGLSSLTSPLTKTSKKTTVKMVKAKGKMAPKPKLLTNKSVKSAQGKPTTTINANQIKQKQQQISKLLKIIQNSRDFEAKWGFTDTIATRFNRDTRQIMDNAKDIAARAHKALDEAQRYLVEAGKALRAGDIEKYNEYLSKGSRWLRSALKFQSDYYYTIGLKDENKAMWARFVRDAAVETESALLSIITGGSPSLIHLGKKYLVKKFTGRLVREGIMQKAVMQEVSRWTQKALMKSMPAKVTQKALQKGGAQKAFEAQKALMKSMPAKVTQVTQKVPQMSIFEQAGIITLPHLIPYIQDQGILDGALNWVRDVLLVGGLSTVGQIGVRALVKNAEAFLKTPQGQKLVKQVAGVWELAAKVGGKVGEELLKSPLGQKLTEIMLKGSENLPSLLGEVGKLKHNGKFVEDLIKGGEFTKLSTELQEAVYKKLMSPQGGKWLAQEVERKVGGVVENVEAANYWIDLPWLVRLLRGDFKSLGQELETGAWKKNYLRDKFVRSTKGHSGDIESIVGPKAQDHDLRGERSKLAPEIRDGMSTNVSLDELGKQLEKDEFRKLLPDDLGKQLENGGFRKLSPEQMEKVYNALESKLDSKTKYQFKEAIRLKEAMDKHMKELHHQVYNRVLMSKEFKDPKNYNKILKELEEGKIKVEVNGETINIDVDALIEAGGDVVNSMREARVYKPSMPWEEIRRKLLGNLRPGSFAYEVMDTAIYLQKFAEEIGLARPFGENLVRKQLYSLGVYLLEASLPYLYPGLLEETGLGVLFATHLFNSLLEEE